VKAKIDVTIADVNLASARADLLEAHCDVDMAYAALNNAMGLPFIPEYAVVGSLPYEKTGIALRDAVEIANTSRPELKMLLLSVKMADQYVKLAKKSALPTIEFSANWASGKAENASSRNWYDAGAYLSFYPINPVLIKGQINEAKHLYEKQRYDAKASVNDIYLDIQHAHERVEDTQRRIPVAELAVEKAKESLNLATGRYRVGESDAIELKDAQMQYRKSQLSYYGVLYQHNSARANLERAIGQTLKSYPQTGVNSELQ
ncbi:type I secretion outer membrane protein, partial [Candidatus Gastranaerophilus sp. (ex Termes propinquus)]